MALETAITPRERAAVAFHLTQSRRRKITEMREEVAELTSALTVADTRIAELTAAKAERAQQQAELREVQLRIMAADEEAATLRRSIAETRTFLAEARTTEINSRVDAALATWRDKKGLTEESRKMLTHLCSSAPAIFDAEYPQIEPEQQHLLRNFTARGSRDPNGGAMPPEPKTMTLSDVAGQIAAAHKIPFDQALSRAEQLTKGSR